MHITPDTLPTGHAGIAARFKKGPTIHSSAWVVPGATVIGDVILEEESSVWYGAVLRGDINRIVIGPRSNIQDNAVVHVDTDYPTSMGELVTVGHTAIVHACKIDNEVLVGMGATILDDVEVGANCTIAVQLVPVATGMSAPDYAISPPGDVSRLFVVEQNGLLRVIENGILLVAPALDIQSRVSPPLNPANANDERGLLGLAFHPGFFTPGSVGFGTLYTYQALFAAESLAAERLKAIAADLKLDSSAFAACVTAQRSSDAVLSDLHEARRLGIAGTPTFIVNGAVVPGAVTADQLRRIIDRELNATRSASLHP